MGSLRDDRRAFGRDVLGPVFAEFAHRLCLYLTATPESPAAALFCARGGLRLRAIFERWTRQMGCEVTTRREDFMISRLLATKVSLMRARPMAIASLHPEFTSHSLGQLARAFLPVGLADSLGDELCAPPLDARADPTRSEWLFFGDHPMGVRLRQHIEEQAALFDQYLASLRRDCSRLVLVDSGLYGRTQLLLATAWPAIDWHGAYFARSNYRHESAPHFLRTTGLMLELDRFSYLVPEAAFLHHWHLIEALLEPPIPSVAWLECDASGTVRSNLDGIDWPAAVADDGNPFYAGVMDHIDCLGPDDRPLSRRRFRQAILGLQSAILAPRQADLELLDVGSRDRDFGLAGGNPVLLRNGETGWRARRRRIGEALWREGQVALELGATGTALLRQRMRVGRALDTLRFLLSRH